MDRATQALTVKELREFLKELPDEDPVMLIIRSSKNEARATWLKTALHDKRARTVDLQGGNEA